MSWDPTFRATLVDRGAAIAAARRLARAVHMERCEVSSRDATLIRRLVGTRPVGIRIALETLEPLVLPPVLLHGRARTVRLQVCTARPPVELGFTRDVDNHPASCFEIGPHTAITRPALVRDCIELAHALGVLALGRDEAVARFTTTTDRIVLPVYADAFPLLASEILASWPSPFFELHAEVDADDVAELLASTQVDADLTMPVALDDDDVFAALAHHEPIAGDPLVVHWDEIDSDVWMTYEHPRGGQADDGRVYSIDVAMREIGCELVIKTIIDHMGVENAAAWLSERAGVAVAYRSPRE